MNKEHKIFSFLVLTFCLSGCLAPIGDGRRQASRESNDVDYIKKDLTRLKEQVDGIASAQQDLYKEIESLKLSPLKDKEETKARLDEIERSLKAAEAGQKKLRDEIIDDLSGKMANILSAHTAGTRSGQGGKHVIGPGETLSGIATTYKTDVNAIIKANDLKDPDNIKVGQTLIIPE